MHLLRKLEKQRTFPFFRLGHSVSFVLVRQWDWENASWMGMISNRLVLLMLARVRWAQTP